MSTDRPNIRITSVNYQTQTFEAELDYGPGMAEAIKVLGLDSNYDRVLTIEGAFYFEPMDDSATLVLDGMPHIIHPGNTEICTSFEDVGLDEVYMDDVLAQYAEDSSAEVDLEYRGGVLAAQADALYDAYKHGDYDV